MFFFLLLSIFVLFIIKAGSLTVRLIFTDSFALNVRLKLKYLCLKTHSFHLNQWFPTWGSGPLQGIAGLIKGVGDDENGDFFFFKLSSIFALFLVDFCILYPQASKSYSNKTK